MTLGSVARTGRADGRAGESDARARRRSSRRRPEVKRLMEPHERGLPAIVRLTGPLAADEGQRP
jgi:hypothetical protein